MLKFLCSSNLYTNDKSYASLTHSEEKAFKKTMINATEPQLISLKAVVCLQDEILSLRLKSYRDYA